MEAASLPRADRLRTQQKSAKVHASVKASNIEAARDREAHQEGPNRRKD